MDKDIDNKQVETTTDQADETPEGQELSVAELKLKYEQAQARIKQLNAESANRRKKLEELETAEQARKQAEMTETQKMEARLKELEADRLQLAEANANLKMQQAFNTTIASMKLVFPSEKAREDAYAVLDKAVAETSMEEAVKSLQKDRAYLFTTSEEVHSIEDGGKRSKQKVSPSQDAIIEKKRKDYAPL